MSLAFASIGHAMESAIARKRRTTMLSFLFGALAGGLAVTYWHAELGDLGARHMPRLRNQTADRLEAAERALVKWVERVSSKTRAGLRADQTRRSEGTMAP